MLSRRTWPRPPACCPSDVADRGRAWRTPYSLGGKRRFLQVCLQRRRRQHGAGLPGWDDLLDGIAVDAGFSDEERGALQRLDALDRAHLVADRLKTTKRSVGDAVVEHLTTFRYSLLHAMLASLPVREVVTTNYDLLFEWASTDCPWP